MKKRIEGKKILLVDDIATTGGSLKKCAQVIKNLNGKIEGVGLLWIRGSFLKLIEMFERILIFSLINVKIDGWSEEYCQQLGPCSRNVPINTEFGHGAEFIKKHPKCKTVTDIPFIAGNNSLAPTFSVGDNED